VSPRVLVLGAQGVLGHFLGRALMTAGWQVLRAGRRIERAEDFRRVDLVDSTALRAALAQVDLAVTTVPDPTLATEALVLRAGGTLLSLTGTTQSERTRLEGLTTDARGLVVVNAGLAPGVTSLVARQLLEEHPASDTVEIALTFSAASTSGRGGARFAYRLLSAGPRHPTTVIPFPHPFGRRRCMQVGRTDDGWLGRLAGDRSVRLHICLAERPLHWGLLAANAIGLLPRLPERLFVKNVTDLPLRLSTERVCEWVAVYEQQRRLAACTIEGAGDYRTTIAAAVAFCTALRERTAAEPARRGIFDVAELWHLRDLAPLLADAVTITAVP